MNYVFGINLYTKKKLNFKTKRNVNDLVNKMSNSNANAQYKSNLFIKFNIQIILFDYNY